MYGLLIVFLLGRWIISVNSTQIHQRPEYHANFCRDNNDFEAKFYPGLSNGYEVTIKRELVATTEVKVKLDSGGALSFGDIYSQRIDAARFSSEKDLINNIYTFILLKDSSNFIFTVKGRFSPNHPPYIISLKINGEEYCKDPDRTYFERYPTGIEKLWPEAPDKFCGRRRINRQYTELILSGSASKSGEWPWHTAIYRLKKGVLEYICGGTLISQFSVLTAAHCVTINGVAVNPEILGVILGKFKLRGNEVTSQDKEIFKVVVHDDFTHRNLNNDIAILKMTTEAVYNNYVQPACLWFEKIYDQLDSFEIVGTVVGWGIDQSEALSNTLREAPMPFVPEYTCIRYDPIFYSNMLNGKKFCAGYNNGTTACNGDSGGGFLVFVPDAKVPITYYRKEERPGAWYVKGIVSVTLARPDTIDSVCDPRAFTVFTDVAQFKDWILSKM